MKSLKEYKQMEWLILFLRNIPSTFKESFIWFLMTYSFPIIQILVIWGIRQDQFTLSIDYETTDSLFYCTNRGLASVGTNLFVNYSYL